MDQPDIPALTDSAAQQTSGQKVLIRYQVRAHPASVLPVAGGRYSHGVVVPSRGINQLIPTLGLSSHALELPCKQGSCALQSIENQLTRAVPESSAHPL